MYEGYECQGPPVVEGGREGLGRVHREAVIAPLQHLHTNASRKPSEEARLVKHRVDLIGAEVR